MKKSVWLPFCILLSFIGFIKIQNIFKVNEYLSYSASKGLYREKANSLDAVYIGGSEVHCFYEPPLGWGDNGIAVLSYSIDTFPSKAVPFIITEVQKTQPDALFIISLNPFKKMSVNDVQVHRITNYLHFSLNKINAIHTLAKEAGYSGLDQLQFYFPIMRFHPRWSELTEWNFTHADDGLKRGLIYDKYFTTVRNITDSYSEEKAETDLSEKQELFFEDFLDFLDERDIKVLFVSVPQGYGKKSEIKIYKQINRMGKMVQSRGYDYLNLMNSVDSIGLQLDTDYFDQWHTNVHGALKFTDFIGKYLKDKYGFINKRGQPGWESWDKSFEFYTDAIAPYTLPFEREHALRDYSLSAPTLNEVTLGKRTITISWNSTEGADGYEIYRKSSLKGEKNWSYIDSTNADTLMYVDSNLNPGTKYTYTVVPKKIKNETVLYGNFDFTGVAGTVK